jgi:hypothetical protein
LVLHAESDLQQCVSTHGFLSLPLVGAGKNDSGTLGFLSTFNRGGWEAVMSEKQVERQFRKFGKLLAEHNKAMRWRKHPFEQGLLLGAWLAYDSMLSGEWMFGGVKTLVTKREVAIKKRYNPKWVNAYYVGKSFRGIAGIGTYKQNTQFLKQLV